MPSTQVIGPITPDPPAAISGAGVTSKSGKVTDFATITGAEKDTAKRQALIQAELDKAYPPMLGVKVLCHIRDDGGVAILTMPPNMKEPPDWWLSEQEKGLALLPAVLGVFGVG